MFFYESVKNSPKSLIMAYLRCNLNENLKDVSQGRVVMAPSRSKGCGTISSNFHPKRIFPRYAFCDEKLPADTMCVVAKGDQPKRK